MHYFRKAHLEWNSELSEVQLKAMIGEVASGFGSGYNKNKNLPQEKMSSSPFQQGLENCLSLVVFTSLTYTAEVPKEYIAAT